MDQFTQMTAFLKSRGQRVTAQKKALLSIFLHHANRMLSVADLKGLLPEGMVMDNATIYRNVQNFEALGLLESMVDMRGYARYMVCGGEHHHHFVCISCGCVISFPCNDPFWRKAALEHKFEEAYHRIEVYGLCENCRNPEH